MKVSTFGGLIAVGLVAPSVYIALKGAGDEPYVTFRMSDAIVQVCVASALMALWSLLIVLITVQVWKKKLSKAWLSALLVCTLFLFYLYQSPSGYLSDLAHWRIVTSR